MTSYEIIKRAIEFNKPDRIPLIFPFLGVSDVHWVRTKNPRGWKPQFDGQNEWGIIWEKPDPTSGIVNMGQVKNTVIANLDEIDSYRFPDSNDVSRYENLEEDLGKAEKRYVLFGWFQLFEMVQHLCGIEKT